MKKLLWLLTITFACASLSATTQHITVAGISECTQDSKYGKHEMENLQKLDQQMQSLIKDAKQQFVEIDTKLKDPDYLDGLSPSGQKELETKKQMLAQEMYKYEGQYQQVLQQAHMQVQMKMMERIRSAAQVVAKNQGFTQTLFKEQCAVWQPEDDVSALIIAEMDKAFELENPAAPAEE